MASDTMAETYRFDDSDDEAPNSLSEIDAFERRLNAEPAPRAAPKKAGAVPQRAKPVPSKKGSEYVRSAVKGRPSKPGSEEEMGGDTTSRAADMKAVSDLDKFDDGNVSD